MSRVPIEGPGDVIRKMLEERGWTQTELATILGKPIPTVNEVIRGKRGVMPDMAVALASAFDTTPEFWMELEAKRQLAGMELDDEVSRRARLFAIAPVKEMQRRGWIRKTKAPAELEAELVRFFGEDALSNGLQIPVALRRTVDSDTGSSELTPLQKAWCFRARNIAKSLPSPVFQESRVQECADRLRELAAFAPEARNVPKTLSDYGIRFVVVEPLPGSKIDGAAFWLDEESPVIALSLRFDRMDGFWFTLCHEFSHVRHRDALSVDTDLTGDDRAFPATKLPIERRADNDAAAMLVDPQKLTSFIRRVGPMYSRTRIIQFAHRMKIHPAIIIGQLQHRGEVGFHAYRDLLVKVRESSISAAVTDGWGRSISESCLE